MRSIVSQFRDGKYVARGSAGILGDSPRFAIRLTFSTGEGIRPHILHLFSGREGLFSRREVLPPYMFQDILQEIYSQDKVKNSLVTV